MSTCRTCHATMRWVQLDTGRAMPIDPIPDERGNVAAKPQGSTLVGYVISESKPLTAGYRLYMPHKANCPEGDRKRRAELAPALIEVDDLVAIGHPDPPAPPLGAPI